MSHLSNRCRCFVGAGDFWKVRAKGSGMPPAESCYMSEEMSEAMFAELREASPIRRVANNPDIVEAT